jgi:hypothetical protein
MVGFYSTASKPPINTYTNEKETVTMGSESKPVDARPVFFFDIDNCVRAIQFTLRSAHSIQLTPTSCTPDPAKYTA